MRPIASLSLDLDNKWSYMKTRGDAAWRSLPSYLDIVVPRVLAFLDDCKLKITVFVVGQDAALEKHHSLLRSISEAGHEIGNHSFHHEPWLHLYSPAEIEAEVMRAHNNIEAATGQRPVGFRGPGYSLSQPLLQTLASLGYRYDASTLPTYLGPLARVYYFATAKLSKEQKEQRHKLFGGVKDGFRPIRPYIWELDGGELLEIPVTTMPGVRVPIHLSYLLYLAAFSERGALLYFRTALKLCRLNGIGPSFLLHPLDFLDAEDSPELAFFPAMKMPWRRKLSFTKEVLRLFSDAYQVKTMGQHAAHLAGVGGSLPRRRQYR